MALAELALPALVALGLLYHLGYAWGLLVLPPALQGQRGLLTPLLGYAIVTIVVATLTNLTALAPPSITGALALLALPLNLWAWWRCRQSKRPHARQLTLTHLIGMGLAALALLAALGPAIKHGAAPIGENWDAAEFYLPLGQMLQTHSQRDLGLLPQNPLVSLLTTPPVDARIHAFSYLHATVSAWSGVEPLRSFPSLMALFLALSLLATIVLGGVLGVGRHATLIAAIFVGLHWLPLWVTFNGFAMHVTAFSMLPVALASSCVALFPISWTNNFAPGFERQTRARSLVTAMLLVAGLALSYMPAISAYIAWMAGLLCYTIARIWRQEGIYRWPMLGRLATRTLTLGLGATLLSGIGQYFFFFRESLLDQSGRLDSGMSINSFAPPGTIIGVDVSWAGLPEPLSQLSTPPLLIALGLLAITLLRRPAPALIMLAGGATLYQGAMLLIGYPYGFYKGVTFAVPLVGLLLASALQVEGWQQSLLRAIARIGLTILLVAVLGAWTSLYGVYWDGARQLFSQQQLQVLGLSESITPEAPVLVALSPEQSQLAALVSYELLGHPLWGEIRTGYSLFRRQPNAQTPLEYALLSAEEDPTLRGYSQEHLVWSGAGLHLYKRGQRTTLLSVLPRRYELKPGQSLGLALATDQIVVDTGAQTGTHSSAAGRQQLALRISSFEPGELELRAPGRAALRQSLPGGMSTLEVGTLDLPQQISLANLGAKPIYLWQVELREPEQPGAAGEQRIASLDAALIQIVSRYGERRFDAAIKLRTRPLPDGGSGSMTALLILSQEQEGEQRELGRWVFFPGSSNSIELGLELESQQASLSIDGAPVPIAGSAQTGGDGNYQAALLLANNGQIVSAYGIWYWTLRSGAIVDAYVDDTVCDQIPLPQPATRLRYRSAVAPLQLEGYTLPARQSRAGEQLDITLFWTALRKPDQEYRARLSMLSPDGSALAQVVTTLGAESHELGLWQPGELGERRTSLALPSSLLPGRYTLAVELIDAAGQPLTLRTPAGEQRQVQLAPIEIN